MSESYADTNPRWTDTERVCWVKVLLRYRTIKGTSLYAPLPTDPLRVIKDKLLRVLLL